MKLPRNPFTHAIAAKEKQIGLWVGLCSPFVADITAPAGFDWVVVDMEHAPNDYLTVAGQLQAFEASPTTALVRPEWNDPVVVKRLLDLGAQGLLFPMIQSVQEAEKAVAATRYPPRGVRGVSGMTRAAKFGRITDYFARVEEETTVLMQLETRAALELAGEIGAVDGVDGVFFGPADIAADIGLLGKPLDDAVWDLIRPAAKTLMDMGVPVGTLVNDPAFAAQLLDEGFTFVACGQDNSLLSRATDSLLAAVKEKLK
jgi:4-hydroxy-2-oxoheptanedioate aldolase